MSRHVERGARDTRNDIAEQEVNIRISAKNVTEAAAKSARNNVTGLGDETERTSRKVQSLGGRVKGFFTANAAAFTAAAAGAAAVVGAVSAAVVAVVKLGQRGAVVGDVQREFAGLSVTVGETAKAMLGALRRGVVETISDFDLMSAANKAMGAGLRISAGDAETLAAGARLLAKRTGGDTTQAFKLLTTAMASGTTTSLRQLGVFVDQKAAAEAYAISIGKTRAELTDAERAAAFNVATLSELRDVISAAGPQAADFGEKLAAVRVRVGNFTDALGVAIADSPVMAAGLDVIGMSLNRTFGDDQQERVRRLTGHVNSFVIGIVKAAEWGVEGSRLLSNTFTGLKVAIASVGVVITGIVESMVAASHGIVHLAAKIPAIGHRFARVRAEYKDTRIVLNAMRKDYQAQVGEALDAGNAQNHMLNQVKADLIETRRHMIAARETQHELTTTTDSAKQAFGAFGSELDATGATLERVSGSGNKVVKLLQGIDVQAPSISARMKELNGLLIGLSHGASMGIPHLESTSTVFNQLRQITPPVTEGIKGLNAEVGRSPGFFSQVGSALQQGVTDFTSFGSSVTSVFSQIFGGGGTGGTLGRMLGGFFGVAGGGGGGAGGFMQSLATAGLSAVTGIMTGGLSTLMDSLGGIAVKGLKKIGGFFKSMFGGPNAQELAGRDVVQAFEANLSTMLSDAGRIEAGNERWKQTVIALREQYVAAGRSEQDALRDAKRLWDSSKLSAEAQARVIDDITRKMEGFSQATTETGRTVANTFAGMRFDIPVNFDVGPLNLPSPGQITVPGAAHGGLFSRPAFRVVAERGPEVVGPPDAIVSAFVQALRRERAGPGTGGGDIYIAVTDRGPRRMSRHEFRQIEQGAADGVFRVASRAIGERVQ